MYYIENDLMHNCIPLDEVRFILSKYFGVKMYSKIPRLVQSVIECSDFDVIVAYNHMLNCKYQNPMTDPIPGDYLLTPSMDYGQSLADYVTFLATFVKQIRPYGCYNPRRSDHFTRRHFEDNCQMF